MKIMDQFFSRSIYVATFYPVAALFIYFIYCISDKNITRVMVFVWGVILIAIAGIIAFQLMTWHPIAQLLSETAVNGKSISKATYNDFDQKSAFLLWFIPFFTGSLGTNLISDALTKPLLYEKKFDVFMIFHALFMLGKFLFWTPILLIAVPVLIICGVLKALYEVRKFPRLWKVFVWHNRKRYKASHARGRFPWEP